MENKTSPNTNANPNTLNPDVWGPWYWKFLHTIAIAYPDHPNAITKKKYYEFIQNLPLFLPVEAIGNNFSKLLDEYPVTAYLDNRESFVRWMHFIHNKINEQLEKPKITLGEFYKIYYEEYKLKDIIMREYYKMREKIIYGVIIVSTVGLISYLYNK